MNSIGFSHDNNYRCEILKSANSKSENYIFLLKLLYEKRRKYLSNYLINDKKALILENALTDLWNCDVCYYLVLFNDKEIIAKIIEILNFIKFSACKWYYSNLHYINTFYVNYSDLFILSFAYNYKNLKDDEIIHLFQEVMSDYYIKDLTYGWDDSLKDSLNIIEENLTSKKL